MITEIRKKIVGTNTYLMWAFVIIVIASLGAPGLLKQSTSSGVWILKINGQEIDYNAFVRTVEAQKEAARDHDGKRTQVIREQEVYNQAIDMLVYRELLDQAAQHIGIHVSPAYVTQRMEDPRFIIPILLEMRALQSFSWGMGIDMRILRKSLSSLGLTVQDFESELSNTIRRELVQQLGAIAGYSPKFEQESYYKQIVAPKTMTVVTFDLHKSIASEKEAGVTKQELQAFYDRMNKNYSEPERRSGSVWEFTPSTFGVQVTNEQIEAYYDKHKETMFIEEPAKMRVRRILLPHVDQESLKTAYALKKELDNNPELFADKARSLSGDAASAPKGGMLEVFARGTHDPAFDKASFLLPKDGAISDVITTKDGLELIQRVERINKVYTPLKKVRDDIHAALTRKNFVDQFETETKHLIRSGALDGIKDFIASHHGNQKAHTAVTRESSKIAQRLFGTKKDTFSAFVEGGKGYIVLVNTIEQARVPKLSEREERVKSDLIEQKAAQRLAKTVQDAKKELALGTSLQEIAKRYHGTITRIEGITSADTDRSAAYRDKGLPIDALVLLEKVGSIMSLQTEKFGYVARLDSVEKIDSEALKAADASIIASLRQERMNIALFGFIASLRRTATIKQNDALINARGQ